MNCKYFRCCDDVLWFNPSQQLSTTLFELASGSVLEIHKLLCSIVYEILRLNEDPNVQGLALDLPESLYNSKVLNAVKPEKDVDGLSDVNLGRLVRGDARDCLVPPTACAVMDRGSSCSCSSGAWC
uniref:Uncharacterized protein n=1 Tax=Accipiter nisus TaxID=211598 RepID=A0A8B9MWD8_9AVES